MWCVGQIDDEYKERLLDIIGLYERPFDPLLPVVCLDEKSVELHADKRELWRTKRGRYRDYEYKRCGTANVFVITEPKGGRHYARVTQRRTRREFAQALRFLEKRYSSAITIHLVMDNLNTHNEASLIETFGDKEGRRLWARFTVHYTPKHASWLNQAEIAISVFARCVLKNARIPDQASLRAKAIPFFRQLRNRCWTINWGFTTKKAKLWVKNFVG